MAGALEVLEVDAGGALAQESGGQGAPYPGASPKQSQGIQRMDSSRLSQVAYMTGLAEIDKQGEDDAGDPDAKGSANLLQVDERTVCHGFMIRGAEAPTAVHVHNGVAGKNGPIVLPFANLPKDRTGAPAGNPGASSGCKVVETQEERGALSRIRRNPANFYVNIHTASFSDGAVRGQLGPVLYDNAG